MKNITNNIQLTRAVNGGTTYYICPWNDYCSTSFLKTWAHALVHAAKKSIVDLSQRTIRSVVRF